MDRGKTCSICGEHISIKNFAKKDKQRWRSYCKSCRMLRNEMLKARQIETPELEKGTQIEVRGNMSNGHRYSSFVSYEKAVQMVDEKVAYIVNPKLIRKYFDRETFRKLVFRRYGNCCIYCEDEATTIDHVIPKSQGGISSFANCVPACSQCNEAKGSMNVEEFLYYYDLSTTIPGMSRVATVRYGLMEIMEKLHNIHIYLNMCLQKIEIEEIVFNDLVEVEELEKKVNEVNETIKMYKKLNKQSLV
ncbi:HNH endonuclease [Bacillus sp. Marseille-Q1617]|uniref:HNH endonuclease n=1 Tax=Bacillus sp. Marseille-Q1617 TaxID=2736887 RepID=UPI00158AFA5C|nr:HNH endonuclease signature motif containing protein [Bacillus sp. Marseille-Q1617]